MTQIWNEGTVIPVTVIKVSPNVISLIRTQEKDGYTAVQLTHGKTKREFRTKNTDVKLDDQITVEAFQPGDKVQIAGVMKGRGFQGVVKRYNFRGGPKTHGQKNRLRAPGSIGSTAPQRVFPGRRMAGHMGSTRITVKNLKVAQIDVANNYLLVKGAVPGHRGTLLEIRKSSSK